MNRPALRRDRLHDAVKAAKGRVVPTRDLVDAIYGDDPDGGPEWAFGAIALMANALRKQGHSIRGVIGRNGGYFWGDDNDRSQDPPPAAGVVGALDARAHGEEDACGQEPALMVLARPRRRFTPAEQERVRKLLAKGWKEPAIARTMGTTARIVTGLRLKMGIRRAAARPQWAQADRDRLAALAAEGLTRAEIADAMKMTKSAIIAMALKLGIEIKRVLAQKARMEDAPVIYRGDREFAALMGLRRYADSTISLRPQPVVVYGRPATQIDRSGTLAA